MEPETKFNIFDRFALSNAKGCICRWSILVARPLAHLHFMVFFSFGQMFCVLVCVFHILSSSSHTSTCNSKYSPTTMSSRGQKRRGFAILHGTLKVYTQRHMHACMHAPKNYGTLKFRECLICEDEILFLLLILHVPKTKKQPNCKILAITKSRWFSMQKSSFPFSLSPLFSISLSFECHNENVPLTLCILLQPCNV